MHEFAHNLNDSIQILANSKPGKVKALFLDAGGPQFLIQYVGANDLVCDRYFRPEEISSV